MRITRPAAAAAALVPAALLAAMLSAPSAQAEPGTSFELVGRYAVPGGAEVSAVSGDRLYVLDGAGIDIVGISNPSAPRKVARVDLSAYGAATTSVAARGDWVAVALVADPKTSPGTVVLLNRAGKVKGVAQVGANPDMVTFDAAGRLLVANEGEPANYTDRTLVSDPRGSVSVIDVARLNAGKRDAVRTIGFEEFDAGGPRAAELDDDVRIYGPGASVSQDLEPEYITVAGDRAFVTLQENNAIAELDLVAGTVVAIRPLALKDHSLPGNALDPSDRENGSGNPGSIAIANWPVLGMPLPDGIASYSVGGETFLVTANEGDARQDWPGYEEEIRVGSGSYLLDAAAFPNAAFLKNNARLGRLTVSNAPGQAGGDVDEDGDRDRIQVFGTRSATIWSADGELVWDSGDLFEQRTALANPSFFNSTNNANEFDTRSDNKGPEPEGVAIGVVDGRTYAFVVLERTGGFIVLDVTDPEAPSFVQYANSRDFAIDPTTTATDSGPEVVTFVPASQSPSGKALVVVSNEISGTVTLWSPAS